MCVTFDGRGTAAPTGPESGYEEREFAADALAVMDATGTERAVLVSLSHGASARSFSRPSSPERVDERRLHLPGGRRSARACRGEASSRWSEELDTDEGWAKYNRHYWLRDYRGFLEFFFSQMFTEPHSTKPIEDCVGWGLETTPETLIATQRARPARRATRSASSPAESAARCS